MKSGVAFVVGKVVDIVGDSFTGKDGKEVKKLSVLLKPDEVSAPIQLEVWGELAEKFERAELITTQIIAQVGIVGREWTKQETGRTSYFVSLRIKEWSMLSVVDNIETPAKTAQQQAPF
jgi:hypothetical protein